MEKINHFLHPFQYIDKNDKKVSIPKKAQARTQMAALIGFFAGGVGAPIALYGTAAYYRHKYKNKTDEKIHEAALSSSPLKPVAAKSESSSEETPAKSHEKAIFSSSSTEASKAVTNKAESFEEPIKLPSRPKDHPPVTFAEKLNIFLNELPSEELTKEFFTKNRGELTQYAFANPEDWLLLSQEMRAKGFSQEMEEGLDALDLIIARKLGIEAHFSMIKEARSTLPEIVNAINTITFNPADPQSIQKAIERMKILYKGSYGDKVVFGAIKIEVFAAWVEQNNILFKDLNLSVNDSEKLVPLLKYLDLSGITSIPDLTKIISLASGVKTLVFRKTFPRYEQLIGSLDFLAHLPRPEQLESFEFFSGWGTVDVNIEALSRCTNLKALNLSYCGVNPVKLDIFKKFEKIENLTLEGGFHGGCLEYFQKSINLKNLTLSGVSDLDVADLAYLDFKHLETLRLAENSGGPPGTQITDKSLFFIKSRAKLKTLALISPHITDKGLQQLKSLSHLSYFSIVQANITGQGFAEWESARAMRILVIDKCNQLSDEGLNQLKQFTQLESLLILWCPSLSTQAVESFKKEMRIPGFLRVA